MRKEIDIKKEASQKQVKRNSRLPRKIFIVLIVLLVLGFLWVVGKGILYLFSRL
jgi:hypothetical protein